MVSLAALHHAAADLNIPLSKLHTYICRSFIFNHNFVPKSHRSLAKRFQSSKRYILDVSLFSPLTTALAIRVMPGMPF